MKPLGKLTLVVSVIVVMIISAALTVAYTRNQAPPGQGHAHGGEMQPDHDMSAMGAGGEKMPPSSAPSSQNSSAAAPSEPNEAQLEASRKQLEASRAQLEASRKLLEATSAPSQGQPPEQPSTGRSTASPPAQSASPTTEPKATDGHSHQH